MCHHGQVEVCLGICPRRVCGPFLSNYWQCPLHTIPLIDDDSGVRMWTSLFTQGQAHCVASVLKLISREWEPHGIGESIYQTLFPGPKHTRKSLTSRNTLNFRKDPNEQDTLCECLRHMYRCYHSQVRNSVHKNGKAILSMGAKTSETRSMSEHETLQCSNDLQAKIKSAIFPLC